MRVQLPPSTQGDFMKYETFKTKGTPTRNDYLVVCAKCDKAYWTMFIKGHIYYCIDCGHRIREGTRKEYQEANNALTLVI